MLDYVKTTLSRNLKHEREKEGEKRHLRGKIADLAKALLEIKHYEVVAGLAFLGIFYQRRSSTYL